MSYNSFQYVRDHYGVPAARGVRITCDGESGTITASNGAHLIVRPDNAKYKNSRWYCHPTWRMTYHLPSGDVAYGD